MSQDDAAMPLDRAEEQEPTQGPAETPGEPLKVDGAQSASKPDAATAPSQPDYLAVIFRDGLDMPLVGLEFIATLPSGEICTAESTAQGAVTLPLPEKAEGQIKLEVKDATGKQQTVCGIDLAQCGDTVIVRSPKTKATVPLRPHQQTPPPVPKAASAPKPKAKEPAAKPPPDKPAPADTQTSWWGANGAWHKAWEWLTSDHHFLGSAHAEAAPAKPNAAKGLSSAGQPVTAVVGPEQPDKYNLRLGRNNVYREAILDASKRLGLIPQALCALMDCEAGKVSEKVPMLNPDGSPAKDKKGRALTKVVRELWNANAGNAQSGAAGCQRQIALDIRAGGRHHNQHPV